MRISDWSSDVCSSDLAVLAALPPRRVSLTHLADRRRPPISALFGGGLGGLPVLEGAMGLLEGLADPAHLRRRVRGREAAAEEAGAVRRARRPGKVHGNPAPDPQIGREPCRERG